MKKVRIMRVNSPNGELHYVLDESAPFESSKLVQSLSEAEVKEITKKEASKPLFITRID
jgi:hypothetical protein